MKETEETKKAMRPLVTTIVVSILVAGIAFFGGMKYQQNKAPLNGTGRFMANGQNRGGMNPGGMRGGLRPSVGEVLSVDDTSVTIKMQDGSTKIILLSTATTYSKSNSGTKSDVTKGTTIAVFGTENADGSLTAQNVQLNPMAPRMMGGTGAPSASPMPNL